MCARYLAYSCVCARVCDALFKGRRSRRAVSLRWRVKGGEPDIYLCVYRYPLFIYLNLDLFIYN